MEVADEGHDAPTDLAVLDASGRPEGTFLLERLRLDRLAGQLLLDEVGSDDTEVGARFVGFGWAVAVDAAGRRLPLQSTWSDGVFEYRVPAAFVEQASAEGTYLAVAPQFIATAIAPARKR